MSQHAAQIRFPRLCVFFLICKPFGKTCPLSTRTRTSNLLESAHCDWFGEGVWRDLMFPSARFRDKWLISVFTLKSFVNCKTRNQIKNVTQDSTPADVYLMEFHYHVSAGQNEPKWMKPKAGECQQGCVFRKHVVITHSKHTHADTFPCTLTCLCYRRMSHTRTHTLAPPTWKNLFHWEWWYLCARLWVVGFIVGCARVQ